VTFGLGGIAPYSAATFLQTSASAPNALFGEGTNTDPTHLSPPEIHGAFAHAVSAVGFTNVGAGAL
jgi:hypothetical protein